MRRALSAAMLVAAACAHPPGPEHAAREYLDALAKGDHARAHALSVSAIRTATPAAALAALAPPSSPDAKLRALRLELEDGRTLWVRPEDGGWRVHDEALAARLTADPRGAARAFLEAALALDLARVRPFLPDEHAAMPAASLRDRLAEDRERHARAAAGLTAAPDAPVTLEGELASIPYDARRAVRLLRQGGRWRVIDVE